MLETYEREGVVLLRNTGLEGDLAAMNKLARLVMGGSMIYEVPPPPLPALLPQVSVGQGGANPRSAIGENVFDVGAPETAHLHYHHEMAYTGAL